jgi:hypothetical protein
LGLYDLDRRAGAFGLWLFPVGDRVNWIVDWWKLLALILFIGVMVGIGAIAKWGIGNWDWWFLAPWLAGFLLIAWIIDRRSKPDSE